MELKIVPSRSVVSTEEASFFSNNKMMYGRDIPASGDYNVGDFIVSSAQEDGIFGWVCVQAGNPGNWNAIIVGQSGEDEKSQVTVYQNIVTFADTRDRVEIGIEEFNLVSDLLEVHYNGLLLMQGVHYNISADGIAIEPIGELWNQSCDGEHEMIFKVTRTNAEYQTNVVARIKNDVVVTREVSEVSIGLTGFDKARDILTVYKNSTYLIEGIDYRVNDTSTKIICINEPWNSDWEEMHFTFEVLKNVSIIPPETLVGMENLSDDVKQAIAAGGAPDLSDYVMREDLVSSNISTNPNGRTLEDELGDIYTWAQNTQSYIDYFYMALGDGNQLLTQNKESVVGAINELFQNVDNGKQLIADAIDDETITKDSTFEAMGNAISTIKETYKPIMITGVTPPTIEANYIVNYYNYNTYCYDSTFSVFYTANINCAELVSDDSTCCIEIYGCSSTSVQTIYLYYTITRNNTVIYTSDVASTKSTDDTKLINEIRNIKNGDKIDIYCRRGDFTSSSVSFRGIKVYYYKY